MENQSNTSEFTDFTANFNDKSFDFDILSKHNFTEKVLKSEINRSYAQPKVCSIERWRMAH